MPWKEETTMSLRLEFVQKAAKENANMRALCRRYKISPTTGYKWLGRYRSGGEEALKDRSRRPHHSPRQTPKEIEGLILKVREEHPAWGGRKVKTYLERKGHTKIPAASTITNIFHRHEKIDDLESQKRKKFQRFEKAAPNQMWQMDFKGYFSVEEGQCHPLTILDDHSRFLVGLHACPDETRQGVQAVLENTFRSYGLPDRILVDNGAPWGYMLGHPETKLSVWLLRLGIRVSHSRPYHPQTLGKDERLHRTLQAEVISRYPLRNLQECQAHFDDWRTIYNTKRPHEALEMAVPADRYQASHKTFPPLLPPVEYPADQYVRKVSQKGRISFGGQIFRVGKAFSKQKVAIRPCETDDNFCVFFLEKKIAIIDLSNGNVIK